jgi:hypothetical protein
MRSKEWPQVLTLRRQIGSKLHTINSGLNSRLKPKTSLMAKKETGGKDVYRQRTFTTG